MIKIKTYKKIITIKIIYKGLKVCLLMYKMKNSLRIEVGVLEIINTGDANQPVILAL
jgi:hypothetical protein